MIIFRYLCKEVFITLIALTTILLLIFMSNQFVLYLTRAANGQLPAMFIIQLMMLELPNLVGLLLPLGFYVALLLAYGRMYTDSEMIVLHACGYGTKSILKASLIMASAVALLSAYIVLWASPDLAMARAKLLRTTGVSMLIKTIIPEQFRALPQGGGVFYVEKMNQDHTTAKHIFLARPTQKNNQWQIVNAERASLLHDEAHQADHLVLKHGEAYVGEPGAANFQESTFYTLKIRLPRPEFTLKATDLRGTPTRVLWTEKSPDKSQTLYQIAELQWRFSIPCMVIVLTLIAVPLSRVNPRSGKYGHLLPSILIFFLYANFLFVSRDWIVKSVIPPWIGLWWVPIAGLCVALYLYWKNQRSGL